MKNKTTKKKYFARKPFFLLIFYMLSPLLPLLEHEENLSFFSPFIQSHLQPLNRPSIIIMITWKKIVHTLHRFSDA